MRLNLLLLMAVSFLPYPTRLVSEAIHTDSAERAAAVFYGLVVFAIAALISALWGAVAADRDLLQPEVSDEEVRAILVAVSPNVAFYAAATAVAIVAPKVAAFGYLAIALLAVLRARGDERQPAASPS